MNKTKQKVSNVIMFLILLFMSIRQVATFLDIPMLSRTSIASDIQLVLLVASITFLFSVVFIYLPALCIVNIQITFPKISVSLPVVESVVSIYTISLQQNNIYKLNAVIRC